MDIDGGDGADPAAMEGVEQTEKADVDNSPPRTSSATPVTSSAPLPAFTPASASPPSWPANSSTVMNNNPKFKFKYPQCPPTPEGIEDITWNRAYNAADSRFYNKGGRSAKESLKKRESGETRILALQIIKDNRAKEASRGGAPSASLPKPKATTTSSTQSPLSKQTPLSQQSINDFLDTTSSNMDMAERIKTEGRARKQASVPPSSGRGTPAPTIEQSVERKMSSPPLPAVSTSKPKKKGTASRVEKKKPREKKPVNKGQADALLAHARSSATPSGSRQTSGTPGLTDDESNDGGEYCVCRGPDDHRRMIACEGDCNDWYHCTCVGIDEDDAVELLERYICPKCTQPGVRFSTWRRFCGFNAVYDDKVRRGILGSNDKPCRKPARPQLEPPSKFCSDECWKDFWEYFKTKLRQDEEPSKGGALNLEEVSAIVQQAKSIEHLRTFGQKPRLPKKEGADPNRPVGLDYLTPEEQKEIEEIEARKADITEKINGYQNSFKLLKMAIARAKIADEHPSLEHNAKTSKKDDKSKSKGKRTEKKKQGKEGETKICGFDDRLEFEGVLIDKWVATEEGKKAMETGVLGPRTAETMHFNADIPFPGYAPPENEPVADELKSICLRPAKKCTRHFAWRDVHREGFINSAVQLKTEFKRLTSVVTEMIDDAETREAMKGYYKENVTEQLP